jgi:hypothetical protein
MIKTRRIRWVGIVARIGNRRNSCRILVGNLEGKIAVGRPGHRCFDNIKMDLRETYGMVYT